MKRKKNCLSCKNFRPRDELSGYCRVDRGRLAPEDYPVMLLEDGCESWQDGGQQYHIRVGWLNRLKRGADTPEG
jgi:hypothetical protein